MGKNKKKRKIAKYWANRVDYHHILFQRRSWKKGWAKKLREHPYSGAMIPQLTLHKQIHEAVKDIPVPTDENCWIAYQLIDLELKFGLIHLDDPLEEKIALFIDVWYYDEPKTVKALRQVQSVVHKFYNPT